LRLSRNFSAIVLVARNGQELQKAAIDVKAAGAETLVCALDLREPQSAETVVKRTLDRFGRIDALLNIAGAVPQIDLFEMTDAQWEDGMALMLHGARRLTGLGCVDDGRFGSHGWWRNQRHLEIEIVQHLLSKQCHSENCEPSQSN
jgi:NAD(P)-dependent dehydrogenase (short-subunit alcohol dehydrogenase family)